MTKPRAVVNGRAVSELAVLITPAAFFVTQDGGTSEVTRCYLLGGKFSLGPERARIGAFAPEQAELDEKGLTIRFNGGYCLFAPWSRLQATWRE